MLSADQASQLAIRCFREGRDTAEATLTLLKFQSQPEAWTIATELLTDDRFSDVVVQFFGAMTLHAKLGTEWVQLSEVQRVELRDLLLKLLEIYKRKNNVTVSDRLCLCLARFGAYAIYEFWPSFIEDSIKILGELDPEMMLDVLLNVPVEVEGALLSITRREETTLRLRKESSGVYEVLHHVFMAPTSDSIKCKALKCVENWAKVGDSLDVIYKGPLFETIFKCVTIEALFEDSIDVLIQIIGRPLNTDKAMHKTMNKVMELKEVYSNASLIGEEGIDVCKGISRVVSAMGEENTDLMCRATEDAISLLNFILTCTQHEEREVSIETLRFWALFQQSLEDNPTHMVVFGDAFARVMEVLVTRIKVPDGAMADGSILLATTTTSSSTPTHLPDHIMQWREYRQASIQCFRAVHRLMLDHFMENLIGLVKAQLKDDGTLISPPSVTGGGGVVVVVEGEWGVVEACLFAVEAVAPALVRTLRKTACRHPNNTHLLYLLHTATHLFHPPDALKHATLNLIGGYCKWYGMVGSSMPEVIKSAIGYMCVCLREDAVRGVPSVAARALHAIYKEMKPVIGGCIEGIVDVWTSSKGLVALHLDTREEVVEAVCGVVLQLSKSRVRMEVLHAIASPLLAHITSLHHADKHTLHAKGAEKVLAQALINELTLFHTLFSSTSSLSFKSSIEEGGERIHELRGLANELWPILGSLLTSWREDEDVIDAVCSVFESGFLCVGSSLQGEIVEACIPLLQDVFKGTLASSTLHALAAVVQAYSAHPKLEHAFQQVLHDMVEVVLTTPHASSHPPIIHALFSLINQTLLYFPAILLSPTSSSLLSTVTGLAISMISCGNRDTCRVILTFLQGIVNPQSTPQTQEVVQSLVQACGEQLLRSLIQGMVTDVHHNLIHYHSDVLFSLVHNYHNEVVGGWVASCFTSIDSPFLSMEDKTALATLVWTLDNKRRFKAMMADLSHVLNAEMTPDVLSVYHM